MNNIFKKFGINRAKNGEAFAVETGGLLVNYNKISNVHAFCCFMNDTNLKSTNISVYPFLHSQSIYLSIYLSRDRDRETDRDRDRANLIK